MTTRRIRGIRCALVSCALHSVALTPAGAHAQHPLVTLPLADPAYVQLDALERAGCRPARVSPYRPFTVGEVRRALASAATMRACAGAVLDLLRTRFAPDSGLHSAERSVGFSPAGVLELRATALGEQEFRPLWGDVRPKSEGDPAAVALARVRLTWRGGDRLVAVSEAYAQTNLRNDPRVRARTFRGTTGVIDFDDAYLAGQVGPMILSVGRGREAWHGSGEQSLWLAAHGPPLDRIAASARWRRWEGRAVIASMNDVFLTASEDSVGASAPERVHRVLVAHALTFKASDAVELSLGETALLSRRGGGIDLAMLNPVMLYVVAENDTGRAGKVDNNNVYTFGAVRVSAGRAVVRAELLVDDIQIDARDRKLTQDQLAWTLAASYAVPLRWPASVAVHYERVDSYTYMRRYYNQAYHQYDRPLGSELGPDADRLRASAELWPSARLRVAGGLGRWRRGSLRVDQRPGMSPVGHAGEPYPSVSSVRPTPQSAWVVDASARWLDAAIPITVGVEVARISDLNNQPTPTATAFRAHLVATYRFRYP